jgi:hypothetical protein
MIESPVLKRWWVREYFPKNPTYRVFPAACDPKDRRRQTVPLLRLRPTSIMRSIRPHPHGRPKALAGLATASERRALALLPSCPPPAPTPSSVRRSVRTFLRQKHFANATPALRRESICEYVVAEKTYRTDRAGDPRAGVRILCFSKTLRTWLPDS